MNAKRVAKTKEIAMAALRLFARKGYDSTSIEEIAAEAGIGKSTVYEYFKTKEALYIETIMVGADMWVSDLEAIGRQERDAVEQLRLVAEMYYMDDQRPEYSQDSKIFIDILFQTLVQDGAFFQLKHLIENIYQRVIRVVVGFLLTGVSRGRLKPDIAGDAEDIAINYMAFLDGIKLHAMIAGSYIDMRRQINLYLENLEPLINAGTDVAENDFNAKMLRN